MTFKAGTTALVSLLTMLLPVAATAYVGPGAGISLVGATIGLFVALATALGFVVVWPLRTLLKRRSGATVAGGDADGAEGRSAGDR